MGSYESFFDCFIPILGGNEGYDHYTLVYLFPKEFTARFEKELNQMKGCEKFKASPERELGFEYYWHKIPKLFWNSKKVR